MHCIWGRVKGHWPVARTLEAVALVTLILSLAYWMRLLWIDWLR
jgi:hypothetical protein